MPQINQDVANVVGVNISTTQTTSNCLVCKNNPINTVHVNCGHLCCCSKCMPKCRNCNCGITDPNHLQMFPGIPDDHDNTPMGQQAIDIYSNVKTLGDVYISKAICYKNTGAKNILQSNLINDQKIYYDPGMCPVCHEFADRLLGSDEGAFLVCGHWICSGCYSQLEETNGKKKCPTCRRTINFVMNISIENGSSVLVLRDP